jgi:hypothetical protein
LGVGVIDIEKTIKGYLENLILHLRKLSWLFSAIVNFGMEKIGQINKSE